MIQILAISGSLRAHSSNSAILRAAQKLAPESTQITLFEALGELPHFNPDLNTKFPPPRVADFRAQLEKADGILICTPEYAHGLPGSFKNALDWTVSSGQWMEKPALILKSSRSNFARSLGGNSDHDYGGNQRVRGLFAEKWHERNRNVER